MAYPSCKKSESVLSFLFTSHKSNISLHNLSESQRGSRKHSGNPCILTEIPVYLYSSLAAIWLIFAAHKSLQRGASPLICFLSLLENHLAWNASAWYITELQTLKVPKLIIIGAPFILLFNAPLWKLYWVLELYEV